MAAPLVAPKKNNPRRFDAAYHLHRGLVQSLRIGSPCLKDIDLDIARGEIFALLGPNGAGKTTLISIVCGLVRASGGTVTVDGNDIAKDYRNARRAIGLVPQELTTDAFETVWATTSFSRGLFGMKADPGHIERVLRDLSLWDKKDSRIMTLSGGMKRRVLIAKALSHEPRILFLDEPTAGVDVELRQDMWRLVRKLRDQGVTIILTTHYIDEAEEMADRVGVIRKGQIILVEEKAELMRKLGKKRLTLQLQAPLPALPVELAQHGLALSAGWSGACLHLRYQGRAHRHHDFAHRPRCGGNPISRSLHESKFPRRYLRRSREGAGMKVAPMNPLAMNWPAIRAIYLFEMARFWRTGLQSIVAPVIATSLYFVVFGAAIGARMASVDGVAYGAFIVPGLIMLSLLTQSIANASFGIYFPRFAGTIYEILSAPVSPLEIVLGYVGAAASKSILIGLIIWRRRPCSYR